MLLRSSILCSFVVSWKVVKASNAADTALSISSFVPAVTCPITSSFAGFITSINSFDSDFTHSPLI